MVKVNFIISFVLSLILLLGIGVVFCEEREIDKVNGFRGLQWGTQLPEDKFDYVRTEPSYGGVKIYKRKKENMKVGIALVDSIEYGVWRDKFCHVLIMGKGDNDKFLQIREAVFNKFGKRNRRDRHTERYVWSGKETWILLKYRPFLGDGVFYMASKKIKEQQKRDKESLVTTPTTNKEEGF